jgi:hypothetical protein
LEAVLICVADQTNPEAGVVAQPIKKKKCESAVEGLVVRPIKQKKMKYRVRAPLHGRWKNMTLSLGATSCGR